MEGMMRDAKVREALLLLADRLHGAAIDEEDREAVRMLMGEVQAEDDRLAKLDARMVKYGQAIEVACMKALFAQYAEGTFEQPMRFRPELSASDVEILAGVLETAMAMQECDAE